MGSLSASWRPGQQRSLSAPTNADDTAGPVTGTSPRSVIVRLWLGNEFSGLILNLQWPSISHAGRVWLQHRLSAWSDSHRYQPRKRNTVAVRSEPLECRQLLSTASIPFVTPAHASTNGLAIAPLATSSPTGFTPQAIRSAYGFDQITFAGGIPGDGRGTTIAIVNAYHSPNVVNDLRQFSQTFGLPDAVITVVNQTGGTTRPAPNPGWITETSLDVQWAHAIAPGAAILLVEANSNSYADMIQAVDYARRAPGVVAVSMSWGSGEFPAEVNYDSVFTTPPGHGGVSFFGASGDTGAPASYPSASPNVVSVGGTTLSASNGVYVAESGWSGSGGGISLYQARPGYQSGIVSQDGRFRMTPDIAYNSNPSTGFPVYDSYNNGTATPWGQWGGTSAAAPQWAALVAIANQGRALAGQGSLDGATQLLPALYRMAAGNFHDVMVGGSTGSPPLSTGTGYDLVTGLGSPYAYRIVSELISATNNASTQLTMTAPSSTLSASSFSVTVTAVDAAGNRLTGYRGTVQFSSTDLAQGVSLPASYTFTAADQGVHTWSGVSLVTTGMQIVYVKDAADSTIDGSATITVKSNSRPVLTGNSNITYVKTQPATAVNSTITLSDAGHPTQSFATITITNNVPAEDMLAFVNNNSNLFGNIAGNFNSITGTMLLTSAGSIASIMQFQAALRAVTYRNLAGNNATLGTRSIQFQTFNGDFLSNVLVSTVTLTKANTTTTLTSSIRSPVVGQAVTLTARIMMAAPAVGIPTTAAGAASVVFYDGDSALTGTVTYSIVSGALQATLTTSNLTSGIHSIKARYAGDANCLGSTSRPHSQSVFRAATTISLTASSLSVAAGQPVTLTAAVRVAAPGVAIPTAGIGTAGVVFKVGNAQLVGTVTYQTIDQTLIATIKTFSLTLGSHSITAVYSRDANNLDSTSAALKVTVGRISTVTSVRSSSPTSRLGELVTLTATIATANPGTGTPTVNGTTANIRFMDGTRVIGGSVVYSVVNQNLIATLTTSSLTAGTHSISAVYLGDVSYAASSSNVLNLTVLQTGTTVVLKSSIASPVYGQEVTFTATVSAMQASSGTPTAGSNGAAVIFTDGDQVLAGSVTYQTVDGKLIATLTTTSLTPGYRSISARYTGDSRLSGSTSSFLKQTIYRAATTVELASSSNSVSPGQQITLTAIIRVAAPGVGIPTAGNGSSKVTFMDGKNVLAGVVSYRIVNGALIATLTTSSLAKGAHSLTAVYSGDAHFLTRTSTILRLF